MRTIVHIGTHRTGSTSLQRLLRDNDEALQEQGIFYPRPPCYPYGAQHNLAWSLRRKPHPRFNPDSISVTRLPEAPPHCDTMILSSEDFERLSVDREAISTLESALFTRSSSVDVVAFVRSQVSFFNSSYCQSVKVLVYGQELELFVEDRRKNKNAAADYVTHLGNWGKGRMRLIVIPYADDVMKEGVERVFFREAGLLDRVGDIVGKEKAVFSNSSPGAPAVAVFREIFARGRRLPMPARERFFSFNHRHSVRAAVMEAADTWGWNATKFWGFDRRMIDRVRQQYRVSNDHFAEQVFGKPWDSVFATEIERENLRSSNEIQFDDLAPADKEQASALIDRVFSMDPADSRDRAAAPYRPPASKPDLDRNHVSWGRLRPNRWFQPSVLDGIKRMLAGRK